MNDVGIQIDGAKSRTETCHINLKDIALEVCCVAEKRQQQRNGEATVNRMMVYEIVWAASKSSLNKYQETGRRLRL